MKTVGHSCSFSKNTFVTSITHALGLYTNTLKQIYTHTHTQLRTPALLHTVSTNTLSHFICTPPPISRQITAEHSAYLPEGRAPPFFVLSAIPVFLSAKSGSILSCSYQCQIGACVYSAAGAPAEKDLAIRADRCSQSAEK